MTSTIYSRQLPSLATCSWPSPAFLEDKGGGSCTKEGGSCTKEGGSCTKEGGSCTKEGGSCTKEGGSCTKEGAHAQRRGLVHKGGGLVHKGGGLILAEPYASYLCTPISLWYTYVHTYMIVHNSIDLSIFPVFCVQQGSVQMQKVLEPVDECESVHTFTYVRMYVQ